MSSVSYTEDQLKAINTHNSDILVSAAAGSGKTAVLVERIINMITDCNNPVDVDSLLVVTFTKAAASEMRERISKSLNNLISNNSHNPILQRQLSLLNKASITTIDAFCGSIVRKNFHILGIDPNFRIANDSELSIIRNEVLDNLLEDYYTEAKPEFLALVESYCSNKNDKKLVELILNIYDFAMSTPSPMEWVSQSVAKFNITPDIDIFNTPWGEIFKEQLNLYFEDAEQALNKEFQNFPPGAESPVYRRVIEADEELLQKLSNAYSKSVSNLYDIFPITFAALGKDSQRGDTLTKDSKTAIKNYRKQFSNAVKNISSLLSCRSPQDMTWDIIKLYPIIKTLGDIVIEFSQRYNTAIQEKMVAGFNDVSHYTLQILLDDNGNPTDIAKELQQKYTEIIIDEYQDSNYVQELILSSVSGKSNGKPNRFMVGDIKQCIYKFRLANPELFTDKFTTYSEEYGTGEFLITLSKNFRSRACVLNAVNFLFQQIMTPQLGGVRYDNKSALHVGTEYPAPSNDLNISTSAECYIIDTSKSKENDIINIEDDPELKDTQLEAILIADKITDMLTVNPLYIYDSAIKDYRCAEPRDIVVLMRSPGNKAQTFVNTLISKGIPAISNKGGSFFDYIEIMTVISLLKIIDNPRQDIPLITILHSPIFNIDSNELTEVKLNGTSNSYYDNIIEYTNTAQNTLSQYLSDFLKKLNHWRELAVYTPITQLLSLLYEETNYFNYVGTLTNGRLRQGNLRVLSEQAIAYEATGESTLFKFIIYLDNLTKGIPPGEAKLNKGTGNAVRLMSVHNSKGLEFPVVFVAGLGTNFSNMDYRSSCLLHQSLGFGPDYVDFNMRTRTETLPKMALLQRMKQEDRSEELRILYVAFTRAKEKLILVGCKNLNSANREKWSRHYQDSSYTLPLSVTLNTTNSLDWLAPALFRHSDSSDFREYIGGIDKTSGISLPYNNNSHWIVKVIPRTDLSAKYNHQTKKRINLFDILNNLDSKSDYSGYKNEIYNNLSWQYPHMHLQTLPSTISISEIKRQHQKELMDIDTPVFNKQTEFPLPQFLQPQNGVITGASRGTAYHTLLENIDFKQNPDLISISDLAEQLVVRGVLTPEEKNSINLNKLKHFISSPIANRIKNALSVHRESAFVMGLTPYEVYNEPRYKDIDSIILVHGIIDLYFEEEDGIVLLDYKTDYVPDNNPQIIIDRYRIQLELYKRALERNTGKQVKETYLYLFGIDKEVKL